ncbi:SURP and G-patch domain-containing protein 1 [Spiromyces aspiralis]|uniref:SURP and G-patch domain-containing protein 1 n=1 Tax=Spiromyces aspiralis TaxID=68401 RepID=A0ACC1HH59_9FUNG|nr:SURP and G-patch domain-containing protein 1 [Spiromyces aspiralis]
MPGTGDGNGSHSSSEGEVDDFFEKKMAPGKGKTTISNSTKTSQSQPRRLGFKVGTISKLTSKTKPLEKLPQSPTQDQAHGVPGDGSASLNRKRPRWDVAEPRPAMPQVTTPDSNDDEREAGPSSHPTTPLVEVDGHRHHRHHHSDKGRANHAPKSKKKKYKHYYDEYAPGRVRHELKWVYPQDEVAEEEYKFWEHRKRAEEMKQTQGRGHHHISEFLPKEELEKFNRMAELARVGKQGDLQEEDYAKHKLTASNKGFQLLMKQGWKEGRGLGAKEHGITAPVSVNEAGPSNAGVGTKKPHEVEKDDDEYEIYRKRMMLAGLRYPARMVGVGTTWVYIDRFVTMGQLNILHHKSWHVYNRENRAKVKTDEEQAQRKHEHAEQQRIQAEREYRLEILRKRARERQNAPDPKGMLASSSNNGRDVAHVAEDDVGQTGPCSILSMPRAAVEPEYSPQSASAEMTAITTTTIATTTTTTNDSRGLVYGAQDLDASERTRPKKLEHRAEKKPEIGLYLGQSATNLANDKTLRTKDEILKLQNDPLTFVRSSLKKSREAREQHAREARALLEGQQASLGNRPDSEREYSITEDKYRYSSQYNPEATYEASRHHSNSMRRARLADGDDGRDEEERKRARRDGDSRQSQSSHRDNHRHHHRHEERKSRRRRLRHTLHSRRSKSPSSERRICGD